VNLRLSFHSLAEKELNEAALYYDTVSPGLGNAFVEEVERAVLQILGHPKAAPEVRRGIRKKLLQRFPYGVLYSIRGDLLRILAIMNLKRCPFYWRGRR
jgi:toxin ParE1/3/4